MMAQEQPGNMIPWAWWNFFNRVNQPGATLVLVQSQQMTDQSIQWIFRLNLRDYVAFYGVWSDAQYNVLKHMESPDWNDIAVFFQLKDVDSNMNFGDAKEDFLLNSAMVPNINFDTGKL